MSRLATLGLIPLIIASAAAVSCVRTSTSLAEGHCAGAQSGDAYCAAQYPDRPFCVLGTNECHDRRLVSPTEDGCATVRPADECYSPCGMNQSALDNMSCGDTTTMVTTTGPTTTNPTLTGPTTIDPDSTTIDSETEPTLGTTTIAPDCAELGCPDDAMPICSDTGECLPCSDVPDPDAACAMLDEATPACVDGLCVQCSEDNLVACSEDVPVCGPNNVCQGCSEHAHCPQSACHLQGPDEGTCFDAGVVMQVSNGTQLAAALNGVGFNDDLVIHLAGNSFNLQSSVEINNGEVAIIGQGLPTISRQGNPVLSVSSNAVVYFGDVAIANGPQRGLDCTGNAVWLDDVAIRNNALVGLEITAGCTARLRRSTVTGNSGGGINVQGSELFMQNSVASANGGVLSTVGGLQVNNASVDITFSTMVANQASETDRSSMLCIGATGRVRNSIVAAPSGDSIIDACAELDWQGSAVDRGGLGGMSEDVGQFAVAWFQNAAALNFRLSATGEEVFRDIARWDRGDPVVDIDGTPIPQDVESYPGYHQP